MKYSRVIHILAGPLLMGLSVFCLPESLFPDLKARVAVGTIAWMAYWWISAPVDYAVTAFLPIVINAFFPMAPMKSVIANYACETILLLLGSSIITVSWEVTGVDRRIAAKLLNLIGGGLRLQIIFWFLVSAGLSAVLPNAVVCATITPIAVSMLKYVGIEDVSKSNIGSKILLTIAYAAGVGGLATPLGGAMNLITVDYIQRITGEEYMYSDWLLKFAPIMIVLVVSNILFMLRDVGRKDTIGASKAYLSAEGSNFSRITFEEIAAIALFAVATILSFTRQFYKDILPGLKPAYVFMTCAVLSFLVSRKDGTRMMQWKVVQKKVVWGLIFIFAGGLALGTLINESGVASIIGKVVADVGVSGGVLTVLVFVAVPFLLSDITSNTATAAVAIPIVISVAQGIGEDPIPYVYVASIGVNLSYMLPTSIRAIPVGYGLSPMYMLKEGWKITLIEVVLMTISAYWLFCR